MSVDSTVAPEAFCIWKAVVELVDDWKRAVPATLSVAVGEVVPIPTLVLDEAPLTQLIEPRTSELDELTAALAPIAVALVKLLVKTLAL